MIDIVIEDQRWEAAGLAALAERAFGAVWAHLGLEGEFEVSVLGCNDARIAGLNAGFRGRAAPTNVLSWPASERASERAGVAPAPPGERELGDIAIAWETSAREAAEQGKTLEDHVTHLLVHAMLHLLGYDHIDDKDAALMEAVEVEVLGKLGLDDPYEG